MAFNFGSITKWTDESGKLITNLIAGSDIMNAEDWTFIGDNTHKKTINIVALTPNIQYGNCVNTPAGTFSFTQREVEVKLHTDRQELCVDELKQYFTALDYQGKGAAYGNLEQQETMHMEKVGQLRRINEVNAFFGATGGSNAVGVCILARTETGSLGGYSTHSALTTGTAAIAKIDAMIDSIPANIFEEELICYMSQKYAYLIINGLITQYGNFVEREKEFRTAKQVRFAYPKFPNLTIIGTHAFNGIDDIFITNKKNLAYSSDLASDMNAVIGEPNTWFQKYLIMTKYYLGFNYAFPANVVYSRKV
jgi:hypothetical protein